MKMCGCIIALILAAWQAMAQDKFAFDIDSTILNKGIHAPASSFGGVMLRNAFTEFTLIPGAYFTIGTVNGLSESALDDRCDLSFGHPYALTSHPILAVDGVWQKPDELFPNVGDAFPLIHDDTLSVILEKPGVCRLEFALVQIDNGVTIELIQLIKNTGTTPRQFGLGLVFDPALGRWGDGHVFLSQKEIARDTLVQAPPIPASLELHERAIAPHGLGLQVNFAGNLPQIIIANWNEIYRDATPSFTPSALGALYDLTLKLNWEDATVAPGEEYLSKISLSLLPPDFGDAVFMRWDLPGFLAIGGNLLFPSILPTTIQVTNAGTSFLSDLALTVTAPPALSIARTPFPFAMEPGQVNFQRIELRAHELYEDRVVSVTAHCRRSGQVIDELHRQIFVPAVPVSDTGLVVQLDTVATSTFPKIDLTFSAKIAATQQLLTRLTADNTFLYEEGAPIREYTFAKDTAGSVQSADIIFALDVTGSMGDEIDDVKNNIIEFADSLNLRGIDVRLGLVTFLDEIENIYPFTTDVQSFQSLIAQQYAHGGDDYPENSLAALLRAAQFSFRPVAKRVVIWITDASYHERDGVTPLSKQQVIDALLSHDITVHAIGNPGEQTAFYDPITIATGGNFYDIDGNFRDILLDISRFNVSGRYRISYTAPANGNSPRHILVEIHYAGLGGSATATYTPPGLTASAKPLLACYPNPFNPATTIRIHNPEKRRGEISIYNILGNRVKQFMLARGEGFAELRWDGHNDEGSALSSGFYFVHMRLFDAQGKLHTQQVQKLVFVK